MTHFSGRVLALLFSGAFGTAAFAHSFSPSEKIIERSRQDCKTLLLGRLEQEVRQDLYDLYPSQSVTRMVVTGVDRQGYPAEPDLPIDLLLKTSLGIDVTREVRAIDLRVSMTRLHDGHLRIETRSNRRLIGDVLLNPAGSHLGYYESIPEWLDEGEMAVPPPAEIFAEGAVQMIIRQIGAVRFGYVVAPGPNSHRAIGLFLVRECPGREADPETNEYIFPAPGSAPGHKNLCLMEIGFLSGRVTLSPISARPVSSSVGVPPAPN